MGGARGRHPAHRQLTREPDRQPSSENSRGPTMQKPRFQPAPSPRNTNDVDNAKMAKLREQRLASDAAKRAAGTFGDMSVIELLQETTGEVFVLSWKGNKLPELAR